MAIFGQKMHFFTIFEFELLPAGASLCGHGAPRTPRGTVEIRDPKFKISRIKINIFQNSF